jgi:hypothetical protein
MDKLIKDKIISEFEVASQYMTDITSTINIEALKNMADGEESVNSPHLNVCMELMKILTRELKIKNCSQHNKIEVLSDEEKYYLASIYEIS